MRGASGEVAGRADRRGRAQPARWPTPQRVGERAVRRRRRCSRAEPALRRALTDASLSRPRPSRASSQQVFDGKVDAAAAGRWSTHARRRAAGPRPGDLADALEQLSESSRSSSRPGSDGRPARRRAVPLRPDRRRPTRSCATRSPTRRARRRTRRRCSTTLLGGKVAAGDGDAGQAGARPARYRTVDAALDELPARSPPRRAARPSRPSGSRAPLERRRPGAAGRRSGQQYGREVHLNVDRRPRRHRRRPGRDRRRRHRRHHRPAASTTPGAGSAG